MRRRDFLKALTLIPPSIALNSCACFPYSKGLKCSPLPLEMARTNGIEPIFGLKTPLLFAHRGGVREAPESTIMGFQHAIDSKADVLELDVQLTKDGQFVVWHGPKLDNVRIKHEANKPIERCPHRRHIYDFEWGALEGKAWVADPYMKDVAIDEVDLSFVPQEKERCLMLLSDFMQKFKDQPLNIEMKNSFSMSHGQPAPSSLEPNVKAFSEIIDRYANGRKIVVVSTSHASLDLFRQLTNNRYPTGLSLWEIPFFWGFAKPCFAYETSYSFVDEEVVRMVRASCSSLFVFVTAFWLVPALDEKNYFSKKDIENVYRLLDMGVDGIMTDRPAAMRKIFDAWKAGSKAISV